MRSCPLCHEEIREHVCKHKKKYDIQDVARRLRVRDKKIYEKLND
jgi:hypothetical protein